MPVSFVLVLLGGAFWLTTMYDQGNANAKAIDTYNQTLSKISRRLDRIEAALNIKDREKELRDE